MLKGYLGPVLVRQRKTLRLGVSLYSQIPKTGGTSPRATRGSTRVCQEAEGSGIMGRRLPCSFLGKNWRGKVKRFRVDESASFQWTLGENGCG